MVLLNHRDQPTHLVGWQLKIFSSLSYTSPIIATAVQKDPSYLIWTIINHIAQSMSLIPAKWLKLLACPQPHIALTTSSLLIDPFWSFHSDVCLKNNPCKTTMIYNSPGIVGESLPRAAAGTNITEGFRATGIFPFNREILTDVDFLPSFVTDQPDLPAEPTTLNDRNCN